MNATVMQLTVKTLLGRKRALLLALLSVALVGLAIVFRGVAGQDDGIAVGFIGGFGLATIVPLICLIAGTGSIGVEIDDGSIVYLLAKPLRRRTIIVSKLVVASGVSIVFGALPVFVAAWVLFGDLSDTVVAYSIGAAVAAVVYCALFLLLSVLTRHAAIIGFLYALVWETTIAGVVPGARTLSVRQWATALVERLVGAETATTLGIESDVGFGASALMLVCVLGLTTWFAVRRLRTIRLAVAE